MKKSIFTFIFSLFAISFISGCDISSEKKLESNIIKTYEITAIDQPKHFYVDIKDVETGRIYSHQYVSKHCNDWRKLKIGSQWKFQEVIYEDKTGKRTVEIHGLQYKLCESLSKL